MNDFAAALGWPVQLSPAAAARREAEEARRAALIAQRAELAHDAPTPPHLPALEGEQLAAFTAINEFLDTHDKQCFSLHGLAGTGKTTVLAHLASTRPTALLATPTGKAATVLDRKIRAATTGSGLGAVTLHRLLYLPQSDEKGNLIGFEPRHPAGALSDWIVLVDEASMVGGNLAGDLLATGARVIAAGDPGQLPPVEESPFFTEPDFLLQNIRRQANGSPIIRQAHAVRAGHGYTNDFEAFQVIDRSAAAARIDWADIVLCWMNDTRHRMNAFIRRRRGIAPNAPPQPGEPLMCLANQPHGMMNGEIFTVTACDRAQGLRLQGVPALIEHPWYEWLHPDHRPPRGHVPLALAYCITVHKAQGSEWPRVLVMDEFDGSDRARWLYTAITRASTAVCLVSRD